MLNKRCVTCGKETSKKHETLFSVISAKVYYWCDDCIAGFLSEDAEDSSDQAADSSKKQDARPDPGGSKSPDH